MLEKLVEASLRYKFLVLIAFGVIAALGWRAVVTAHRRLPGRDARTGQYLHRIVWLGG